MCNLLQESTTSDYIVAALFGNSCGQITSQQSCAWAKVNFTDLLPCVTIVDGTTGMSFILLLYNNYNNNNNDNNKNNNIDINNNNNNI